MDVQPPPALHLIYQNMSRHIMSTQILKTHCLRGHEFTDENTIQYPPASGRYCRQCKADKNTAARAARKVARDGRKAATVCSWGHEFTPQNTYVIPGSGRKKCRTCQNARAKQYRDAAKVIRDEEKAVRAEFEAEIALAMAVTCSAGHDLTGEGSYTLPDDAARHCRTCKQEEQDARRRAPSEDPAKCSNGHPWLPETTYTPPTGYRQCRTCRDGRKVAAREAAKGRKDANWQALVDEYEADMRAKGMIL